MQISSSSQNRYICGLNVVQEEVNEHKATRQPNAARDFIDVYLEAIDNDPSKDFHGQSIQKQNSIQFEFNRIWIV